MLLLKVVGMLLKYELNELAITSCSLIMMPFSLTEVLDDCGFYQDHTFLLFPKELTLKNIMIILLSGSSGYFSE